MDITICEKFKLITLIERGGLHMKKIKKVQIKKKMQSLLFLFGATKGNESCCNGDQGCCPKIL